MGQQGFFIESEEELEASLHDLHALVDHQRDQLQHLLEKSLPEQRSILYFIHQSLIPAALLIRSQQKYQKFLEIQPLRYFFDLRQGDLILRLGKFCKGGDGGIIHLFSDVSLGPYDYLLAEVRAHLDYFFVLGVSDPEGEDGGGADWCFLEESVIFGEKVEGVYLGDPSGCDVAWVYWLLFLID